MAGRPFLTVQVGGVCLSGVCLSGNQCPGGPGWSLGGVLTVHMGGFCPSGVVYLGFACRQPVSRWVGFGWG